MNIKPVKTRKDYQAALGRLKAIFDAKPGTHEGDELEILGILIDKYEQEHYRVDYPKPVEAVRFRMSNGGIIKMHFPELV